MLLWNKVLNEQQAGTKSREDRAGDPLLDPPERAPVGKPTVGCSVQHGDTTQPDQAHAHIRQTKDARLDGDRTTHGR